MNVEIGTETPIFHFWEYLLQISAIFHCSVPWLELAIVAAVFYAADFAATVEIRPNSKHASRCFCCGLITLYLLTLPVQHITSTLYMVHILYLQGSVTDYWLEMWRIIQWLVARYEEAQSLTTGWRWGGSVTDYSGWIWGGSVTG